MDEDDSMLEKNIWEYIAPYIADRNGRIYIKNEEYQEAVKNADKIYDELEKALDGQQAELLEKYSCSYNSVTAVMERLVYQQGMRDMLVLLISILKNGGKK